MCPLLYLHALLYQQQVTHLFHHEFVLRINGLLWTWKANPGPQKEGNPTCRCTPDNPLQSSCPGPVLARAHHPGFPRAAKPRPRARRRGPEPRSRPAGSPCRPAGEPVPETRGRASPAGGAGREQRGRRWRREPARPPPPPAAELPPVSADCREEVAARVAAWAQPSPEPPPPAEHRPDPPSAMAGLVVSGAQVSVRVPPRTAPPAARASPPRPVPPPLRGAGWEPCRSIAASRPHVREFGVPSAARGARRYRAAHQPVTGRCCASAPGAWVQGVLVLFLSQLLQACQVQRARSWGFAGEHLCFHSDLQSEFRIWRSGGVWGLVALWCPKRITVSPVLSPPADPVGCGKKGMKLGFSQKMVCHWLECCPSGCYFALVSVSVWNSCKHTCDREASG